MQTFDCSYFWALLVCASDTVVRTAVDRREGRDQDTSDNTETSSVQGHCLESGFSCKAVCWYT